uniref:Uncharacterized protein n=1 Tax=Arundo donax TaxID=35708 RepID=A0A0A9H0G7_ARUDO
MQPEDVREEHESHAHGESPVDRSLGCPLPPASAEKLCARIGDVSLIICSK